MAYRTLTERESKPRSGIALGGIGAGWFEIRQDGTFCNWNIFNNQPLGRGKLFPFNPHNILFFLLRYQEVGGNPRLLLLQIEDGHGAAAIERTEHQYLFPWITGVDRISYEATVPFAKLEYYSNDVPLRIELTAWSPFMPRDTKNSSLPAVFFDFKIRSRQALPVDISLLATMRNAAGYDVKAKHYVSQVLTGATHRTVMQSCDHLDPKHSSWGSLGLTSVDPASHYYLGWEHPHPYYERLLREPHLPDHDDTPGRNSTDSTTGLPACLDRCFSTIGKSTRLETGHDELSHSFVASWYFPNNYARLPGDPDSGPAGYLEEAAHLSGQARATGDNQTRPLEGHFYTNWFDSAASVAAYAVHNRDYLLRETTRFHDAFYASSIEPAVLDQVNSQLNTFRTSSWLTRAGDFGIYEGLSPDKSWAGLSTIDVAMYGDVATAMLFPELNRAVVNAHRRLQNPDGSILHSISANFHDRNPAEASAIRVDLPAQYAYLSLRAAFWSEKPGYLKEIWPSVQAALDYVLRERDGNGDLLPDMSGIMCSYDNFPMYGIAPYVATQWLVAVAAAVEAARELNDVAAQEKWQHVFDSGRRHFETATWNGKYYRLYSDLNGPHGDQDEGCLTDQLLGQWAAHLLDLPRLVSPEAARSALGEIIHLNYFPGQGLRNCRWPGDGFLHPVDKDCWVDQANTCWTGVELAFASFLIYEGMVEEGLRIIREVDRRYRRWGIYWDHQEFGGHYYRPMSALAVLPAFLGFSARQGVVTFAPKCKGPQFTLLFTTADGYGHWITEDSETRLKILSGEFRAREVRCHLETGAQPSVYLNDQPFLAFTYEPSTALLTLKPPQRLHLKAGESLSWKVA
jgi:non-lysosomal glucosylceramidase